MTETEVRQFLQEYFHASLCEPNVDAFLQLLTPDAVLEDPVGTSTYRGHEAIRQLMLGLRAQVERVEFTIHEVIPCGKESAARWTVNIRTKKGTQFANGGIGIFVFAEPRKLSHIREFWDVTRLEELMS